MINFGTTLKTLRLKENLTQAMLAQKLGLTKSVISAYETGLRMPSYDVLIHIAKTFNVSTDFLLGIENKNTLDLSGLSQAESEALLQLIRAMQKN
ncbi:MAG: helix-turn-helix transcriptional regulator [Lachnospiraceae bacterium]|nr:helix-turn-helix transcriptional regulator [Lachnospiraceae bacterium]